MQIKDVIQIPNILETNNINQTLVNQTPENDNSELQFTPEQMTVFQNVIAELNAINANAVLTPIIEQETPPIGEINESKDAPN